MKNELNEFLGSHRKQFDKGELLESTTPADPFPLFNTWLSEAIAQEITEPYAMVLSTCVNNQPSQRVVYLRGVSNTGLVFYTNYLSKKGIEATQNPQVSALFFWAAIERQVRIEGILEPATKEVSDEYFNARPRTSQLGAWASEQSKIIASRQVLDDRMQQFDAQYKETSVPRPEHWGGYVLVPAYFEFWQGRPNRLHDRIAYAKAGNDWVKNRLAP